MKQQKRINKIIEAVESRVQEEVGGLLGAEFSVVGGDKELISKEDAFKNLQGKQICAQMDITGDITGNGCLLIGIKDAIRLGGTLIMLPESELEEVIGREEYSEEIEDSYGEIANIIAGSFTKDFEEMYPKSCRFVRKEQAVLIPAKVDVESESPVQDQTFYQVSAAMSLDGHQMGNLVMLMPAATFDLAEDEETKAQKAAAEESPSQSTETAVQEKTSEKENKETVVANSAIDEQEQAAVETPPVPKVDLEKQKKRVDKLLSECQKRMEGEVAALLGAELVLGAPENKLISKEDFFLDHVVGKQVLADMEVVGEAEGMSYLSTGLKDAIHLGGILIMLPPSELDNVVQEEDFSEDTEDAFGEIANIIAGVYTAVFEEQFNPKVRFIRKELQEVIPAKVDIESDQPLPDTSYYVSSIPMTVDGKSLGNFNMAFPVDLLKLDGLLAGPEKQAEENNARPEVSGTTDTGTTEKIEPQQSGKKAESGLETAVQQSPPTASTVDVKKQQKLVDGILGNCRVKMADEVSALLGTDVKLSNLENFLVSKEDFFFDEVSGKQVIADLEVQGELEGKSYLSVGLKDAIRIGGVLIMLPNSELETVVGEEDFSEDTQDAYGEIANIISGVYTAVFEEQYSKQIRFVKTELQQVAPMKVDVESAEPIPDQDYYLSRMDLSLGELELGKVNVLFPVDLLELSGLRPDAVPDNDGVAEAAGAPASIEAQEGGAHVAETSVGGQGAKPIDILLVADDNGAAAQLEDTLSRAGFSVKTLSFKDNLHNYIPGNLKAVYLVMRDVNEQAFGVAIKVSSACSVPLIAAGPEWTRTKVIKAVKYGVRDILLTPATEEDIQESIDNNFLELAA